MDDRGVPSLWRVVQRIVWLLGAAIVGSLFAWPTVGLQAFWNVLIPVAPALLVFAPGVWRNICPLATTALLADRMELSKGSRLSIPAQGRLFLAGVLLLAMIVPLRRLFLNASGPATGITLLVAAAAALLLGWKFGRKSPWCAGLCPVYPVERLYGIGPAVTPANARCSECRRCSLPCPDSTPAFDPNRAARTPARRAAGTLLVGGFVGFVFGWFQVPDFTAGDGWRHLASIYGLPLAGGGATLALYLFVRCLCSERLLARLFAAAAVSCYYWFRLPMLFGFGEHPGFGVLLDLSGVLPPWAPLVSRAGTTALFLAWFLAGAGRNRPWSVRPPFAFARGAASPTPPQP